MRFNDIQDTRKTEKVKSQKSAAFHKLFEDCMRKFSSLKTADRIATVKGVVFAV